MSYRTRHSVSGYRSQPASNRSSLYIPTDYSATLNLTDDLSDFDRQFKKLMERTEKFTNRVEKLQSTSTHIRKGFRKLDSTVTGLRTQRDVIKNAFDSLDRRFSTDVGEPPTTEQEWRRYLSNGILIERAVELLRQDYRFPKPPFEYSPAERSPYSFDISSNTSLVSMPHSPADVEIILAKHNNKYPPMNKPLEALVEQEESTVVNKTNQDVKTVSQEEFISSNIFPDVSESVPQSHSSLFRAFNNASRQRNRPSSLYETQNNGMTESHSSAKLSSISSITNSADSSRHSRSSSQSSTLRFKSQSIEDGLDLVSDVVSQEHSPRLKSSNSSFHEYNPSTRVPLRERLARKQRENEEKEKEEGKKHRSLAQKASRFITGGRSTDDNQPSFKSRFLRRFSMREKSEYSDENRATRRRTRKLSDKDISPDGSPDVIKQRIVPRSILPEIDRSRTPDNQINKKLSESINSQLSLVSAIMDERNSPVVDPRIVHEEIISPSIKRRSLRMFEFRTPQPSKEVVEEHQYLSKTIADKTVGADIFEIFTRARKPVNEEVSSLNLKRRLLLDIDLSRLETMTPPKQSRADDAVSVHNDFFLSDDIVSIDVRIRNDVTDSDNVTVTNKPANTRDKVEQILCSEEEKHKENDKVILPLSENIAKILKLDDSGKMSAGSFVGDKKIESMEALRTHRLSVSVNQKASLDNMLVEFDQLNDEMYESLKNLTKTAHPALARSASFHETRKQSPPLQKKSRGSSLESSVLSSQGDIEFATFGNYAGSEMSEMTGEVNNNKVMVPENEAYRVFEETVSIKVPCEVDLLPIKDAKFEEVKHTKNGIESKSELPENPLCAASTAHAQITENASHEPASGKEKHSGTEGVSIDAEEESVTCNAYVTIEKEMRSVMVELVEQIVNETQIEGNVKSNGDDVCLNEVESPDTIACFPKTYLPKQHSFESLQRPQSAEPSRRLSYREKREMHMRFLQGNVILSESMPSLCEDIKTNMFPESIISKKEQFSEFKTENSYDENHKKNESKMSTQGSEDIKINLFPKSIISKKAQFSEFKTESSYGENHKKNESEMSTQGNQSTILRANLTADDRNLYQPDTTVKCYQEEDIKMPIADANSVSNEEQIFASMQSSSEEIAFQNGMDEKSVTTKDDLGINRQATALSIPDSGKPIAKSQVEAKYGGTVEGSSAETEDHSEEKISKISTNKEIEFKSSAAIATLKDNDGIKHEVSIETFSCPITEEIIILEESAENKISVTDSNTECSKDLYCDRTENAMSSSEYSSSSKESVNNDTGNSSTEDMLFPLPLREIRRSSGLQTDLISNVGQNEKAKYYKNDDQVGDTTTTFLTVEQCIDNSKNNCANGMVRGSKTIENHCYHDEVSPTSKSDQTEQERPLLKKKLSLKEFRRHKLERQGTSESSNISDDDAILTTETEKCRQADISDVSTEQGKVRMKRYIHFRNELRSKSSSSESDTTFASEYESSKEKLLEVSLACQSGAVRHKALQRCVSENEPLKRHTKVGCLKRTQFSNRSVDQF